MRSDEQRAIAANADDEIGLGELAFERGAEPGERTLLKSDLSGFQRPAHRVDRAFLLGVGTEQTFGSLIAFAGEAGRAPSLRHRGLLDDDQTVTDLHRRYRSLNQSQEIDPAPSARSDPFSINHTAVHRPIRVKRGNAFA